ncbi:MAG TPA: hypothetical protein VHV78_15385, partial [Gemmatimonadaceae bacterium]|nr:hypothetical protein [Gemmatimonadaceae bacterium]
IESEGGPEGYLDHLTQVSHIHTQPSGPPPHKWRGRARWQRANGQRGLFGLPTSYRLALEMSLHEEAERRALQGELMELERAWRDAEEIAGIADDLLLPESIGGAVERLKRG